MSKRTFPVTIAAAAIVLVTTLWLWMGSGVTAGPGGGAERDRAGAVEAPRTASRHARNTLEEAPLPETKGALSIRGKVSFEGAPVSDALVVATAAHAPDVLAALPCECDNQCGQRLLECGCSEAARQLLELVLARHGEAAPLARTRTRSDGTFELTGLEHGTVKIWAEKHGAGIAVQDGIHVGSEIAIELQPAHRLHGTVTDEQVRPAPGAIVTAIHKEHSRYFETTTAEDGTFELPLLISGDYRLVASSPGLLPEDGTASTRTAEAQELVLQAPRTLEGRVTEGGAPVAEALVAIDGEHRKEELRSDREGRFRFSSLRPGRYEVAASAPGRGRKIPVRVREDPTTVELDLKAASKLKVQVRDNAGAPISAASVEAMLLEGTHHGKEADTTGPDGVAQLELFGGGTWRVRAEAPGFVSSEWKDVAVAEGGVLGFTLTLGPAARITGVVIDALGAPVHRAEVMVSTPDDADDRRHEFARERSDADGRFAVATLPPGEYEFEVEHSDHPRKAGKLHAPGDVRIVLDRGASVRGRFLAHDGSPVVDADVSLTALGNDRSRRPRRARTGAEGEFVLEGLSAGPHQVTGTVGEPSDVSSFRTATATVELRAGAVTEILLRLGGPHSVEGVVVDGLGQPVANMGVILVHGAAAEIAHQRAPPRIAGARSGPDGRFVVHALEAGRYEAFVAANLFPDEVDESVPVTVPTSTALRLVHAKYGKVVGRVVDSEGSPIAVFAVNGSGIRDATGRFEHVLDGPGEATLRFTSRKRAPRTIQVSALGGETIDVGDVSLSPGRTIEGRVESEDGAPVEGATVSWSYAVPSGHHARMMLGTTNSNARGRFRIENAPEETIVLLAARADSPREEVTIMSSQTDVVVRLRRGARLTGTLVDDKGQPVTRGTISVQVNGETVKRGQLGGDGTFEVTGLPAGVAWVQPAPLASSAPSFIGKRVELTAGETTRVVFRAEGGNCDLEVNVDRSQHHGWPLLLMGEHPLPPNLSAWRAAEGANVSGGETESGERYRALPPGQFTLFIVWPEESGMRIDRRLISVTDACPPPVSASWSSSLPLLTEL